MAESRIEALLENILGADNALLPPESRNEVILHNILGADYPMEAPQSRIEVLLQMILEQGIGGGGDEIIKTTSAIIMPQDVLAILQTTSNVEVE